MKKIQVILLALLPNVLLVAANSYYGQCNPDQTSIGIGETLECIPREVLVKLDLPNNTYMNIAPDHVKVLRCGGSCPLDR